MIVDPFTVAANAPTPSLVFAMTRSDGYGSERVDTGGNGYALTIQHTPGKNSNRHYVKITQTKDATNPYSGLVQSQAATVSVSVSSPSFGFTPANLVDLWEALVDSINDPEVTMTRLLQNQS
jgi:hypothetical protein